MNRTTEPGLLHYNSSKQDVGWVERTDATPETYSRLGFKCGLEIHQQLKTDQKLFCRCPAGRYQRPDQYDAEVVRHMRPTLSELGEYDGTALMEFKTRKNIFYRIAYETACTYDIDDTPPFRINRQALAIAIEVSLLCKLNVVGELHVTRKQYLDGSIPTGFQRTGIIGIEGEIPLRHKKVRIIQLSIEEDSCREVSDVGHNRVYRTDRLGMPLIETVTYPDLLTPDEAAEAAHYLRFLVRSTGKVRIGMGAARQDVNVSVKGGQRVEIKGVAHIAWIPELVHIESFRQKSLLKIRDELLRRLTEPRTWKVRQAILDLARMRLDHPFVSAARERGDQLVALALPGFGGLLSHFTQPGRCFADELADRLKVIACLERPNMLHNEMAQELSQDNWHKIGIQVEAGEGDALLLIATSDNDLTTAVSTVQERCELAFVGVPNETRKSCPDGTTLFERVLPGPDRMYPDTDSAPISIGNEEIESIRAGLPPSVAERLRELTDWSVPEDQHTYILRNNLMPLVRRILDETGASPKFVVSLLARDLKHAQGTLTPASEFTYSKILGLMRFLRNRNLDWEIARVMVPVIFQHPNMLFDSVLDSVGYRSMNEQEIIAAVPPLLAKFARISRSSDPEVRRRWVMGQLRKAALGNMPLRKAADLLSRETARG